MQILFGHSDNKQTCNLLGICPGFQLLDQLHDMLLKNAQILSALHQDTHSGKDLCIQITAHLKCLFLFKEGTCQPGLVNWNLEAVVMEKTPKS